MAYLGKHLPLDLVMVSGMGSFPRGGRQLFADVNSLLECECDLII